MFKPCGSTLSAMPLIGGVSRNALSFRRHVPAAVAVAAKASLMAPARTSLPAGNRGQVRLSSSSSQWKERQGRDYYSREAKVKGLRSRAAFKLVQMHSKYELFKKGALVVDLGYAPGSWSQIAMQYTKPTGRVLGIDLIPAQPPKGVAVIQGNFLSPSLRKMVKQFIVELHRSQLKEAAERRAQASSSADGVELDEDADGDVLTERPSYIDMEHQVSQMEDALLADEAPSPASEEEPGGKGGQQDAEASPSRAQEQKLVDPRREVMQPRKSISDISSNHDDRMMNTSGIAFRDHAGSMDLCMAALDFANENLKPGGHFVCKFYQGSEDKDLEKRLRKLFTKVHRDKPQSSRSESKEAYFVALWRKKDVDLRDTGDS